MKTAFKQTASILAISSLLLPTVAMAQERGSEKSSEVAQAAESARPSTSPSSAVSCAKLTTAAANVSTKTSESFKNLDDNFARRSAKITAQFDKISAQIA